MPVFILSPAKSLDESNESELAKAGTDPKFQKKSGELVEACRNQGKAGLAKMMRLSDKLAKLNHDRFSKFEQQPRKPAIEMFEGDAFKSLKQGDKLSVEQAKWLQPRLRILSGLYGCLKPLDLIRAYRLEMGSKNISKGISNLPDFWNEDIANDLQEAVENLPSDDQRCIINVASQEYSTAAKLNLLQDRNVDVITIKFDAAAPHAKKARGAIVRHALDKGAKSTEDLKDFTGNDGEWEYDSKSSGQKNMVFKRKAVNKQETKKRKPSEPAPPTDTAEPRGSSRPRKAK